MHIFEKGRLRRADRDTIIAANEERLNVYKEWIAAREVAAAQLFEKWWRGELGVMSGISLCHMALGEQDITPRMMAAELEKQRAKELAAYIRVTCEDLHHKVMELTVSMVRNPIKKDGVERSYALARDSAKNDHAAFEELIKAEVPSPPMALAA